MPYYREGEKTQFKDEGIAVSEEPRPEEPIALASYSTDCEHEFRDGGIQKTGERVWFCVKCPHGYEERVVS